MFFKKGNTFCYPHWDSYVPRGQHSGVYIGRRLEILKICGSSVDSPYAAVQIQHLHDRLRARGYPEREMRRIWDGYVRKTARKLYGKSAEARIAFLQGERPCRTPQEEWPTHSDRHLVLDYHADIDGRRVSDLMAEATGFKVDIAWRVHTAAVTRLQKAPMPEEAGRQHFSPPAGVLTAQWTKLMEQMDKCSSSDG